MAKPKKPSLAKPSGKGNQVKVLDNEIKVFPAKRFFVESLTRDIDLADAILDLLDNCVDGARRVGLKGGDKPYLGYRAEVRFDGEKFIVEDNCGGISLKDAKESALCFGRPAQFAAKADGTIGIIGIGMKRAIFKIGRSSVIRSQHKADTFQIKIDPEWLQSDNWKLYFEHIDREQIQNGTRITVTILNDTAKEEFESSLFKKKLWEKVTGAFALLIARGFEVKINGDTVTSQIPTLLWQDIVGKDVPVIQPYVFRDVIDSVHVYIAVGFRAPDNQTEDAEDAKSYYRTEPAGWTIACNDRVVLFCDKSEQTGWGTGRVPEYHTQFIRVSGFAEFRSQDPTKLPFTTTKHGINQQSKVFLKVFDKLREGTKTFTDWTYQFKDYASQKDAAFDPSRTKSLDMEAIKQRVTATQATKPGAKAESFTYKPKLPQPKTDRKERTISFRRSEAEVKAVSNYLFGDQDDVSASRVGEECFDLVLKKAKK
jgi:histidine kinase/DNA gyrase B/HSP90-like ATPase